MKVLLEMLINAYLSSSDHLTMFVATIPLFQYIFHEPYPVTERTVWPILVSPLRRHVEKLISSWKLFVATAVRRIGVKYLV